MKNDKENIYVKREQDWRNGAIVYQVLVDRFAPSLDLENKKHLYKHPKTLKTWEELPKRGKFVEDAKYWSHELEYWGGDLKSLMAKISYLKNLGVDVLYLNPIFESISNHKYDASDYLKISEEFGTFEDLKELTEKLKELGIRVMLDGVFNHVGISNPIFQEASKDKTSPYRNWFDFNPKYPDEVRLWADAKSLPELNLENDDVKDYIYRSSNSVLKTYLKAGIDGWRLDVAFDIGYDILKDLTEHAHDEKEKSMIVGEIWNYPEKWLKSIDGVMNFTLREIIYRTIRQQISTQMALKMIKEMIDDAGIEPILKSWNVLDNHDVKRLLTEIKHPKDQKIAQLMQFTLPGSPNLYYGTELGMDGDNDPENRAPMRWDMLLHDNSIYSWTKKLIELHQTYRALKIGDFKPLITNQLFAFERYTDCVEDTIIVVINTTDDKISESMMIKDSNIMNYSSFDILLGESRKIECLAGFLKVELEPKSFVVFKPKVKPDKSYTPYKRI